jgi:BMFP domain-containing protein YqiC
MALSGQALSGQVLSGQPIATIILLQFDYSPAIRRGRSARQVDMTQTTNRFLDEIARLMNDAAGVASGVRREVDTVFRNQADRILRELDVVKREEFEAVKDMARIAREENEALKTRIAALEAKIGTAGVA